MRLTAQSLRALFEHSLLRYIGVGGTAFIVDFGFTVGLARAGVALWLSVSIGYFAGFLVNFAGQRNFAFNSDRSYGWSLVLYFALVVFNWMMTTALMYLFVEGLGWPTSVSKILCTVATTVWNYPIYRFLIFAQGHPVAAPQSVPLPRSIDFIMPAHNSATVIGTSLRQLDSWAAGLMVPVERIEAIVVENASVDDTAAVVSETGAELANVQVTLCHSPRGIGQAYREGIAASSGELLVLTADDLPFGTTDIDHWLNYPTNGVSLGSKAHGESQIDRPFMRRISSWGFAMMRRLILHSRVRDPQGTVLAGGQWLRQILPLLSEDGYLSSTEIVAIAEHSGVPILERPVHLSQRHTEHGTRIRPSDIWNMAVGLVRLQRRVKALTAVQSPALR